MMFWMFWNVQNRQHHNIESKGMQIRCYISIKRAQCYPFVWEILDMEPKRELKGKDATEYRTNIRTRKAAVQFKAQSQKIWSIFGKHSGNNWNFLVVRIKMLIRIHRTTTTGNPVLVPRSPFSKTSSDLRKLECFIFYHRPGVIEKLIRNWSMRHVWHSLRNRLGKCNDGNLARTLLVKRKTTTAAAAAATTIARIITTMPVLLSLHY